MSLKPASDVVSRRLGDSAVLIRLTTNRIYELNATGARFWELMQAGSGVDEIMDTLAQEFAVPLETVRADIAALLQRLNDEGLVGPQ